MVESDHFGLSESSDADIYHDRLLAVELSTTGADFLKISEPLDDDEKELSRHERRDILATLQGTVPSSR